MEDLEDESLTSSKYLGKVSITEDGNVIINPVNPDVAVGSGMRIVICDRDGELIAVIPEDDEFKGGVSLDVIGKGKRLLQNAEFTLKGKTGTAIKRAELAINYITDTQTLLENIKEKTCTLTWREDGTALADCSNCGEGQLYNDYNYCPNCRARNINPEDEPIIPPAIQRCPNCDEPYNPKPGVFMVKCLNCGADMWEDPSDHPDGEVDIPPVEEPEEPELPSDEYFEEAKRHEIELMGGAPEHLFDRAVPSLQKMLTEVEEPEPETYDRCERCEPKCDAATPHLPEDPEKEEE